MRSAFVLIVLSISAFAACPALKPHGLLYCEDFNDQDIDPPSVGNIIVTSGGGSISLGSYLLNKSGLDGYSLSSGTVRDPYLWWSYSARWPSDEMYVSFHIRYPTYTQTDPNENFKIFYPHWNGLPDSGPGSYLVCGIPGNTTIYCSTRGFNKVLGDGQWIEGRYAGRRINPLDGKWHRYEWYIDFRHMKWSLWYDNVLMINRSYDTSVWSWDLAADGMDYITFGAQDSEEPGNFTRRIDDIEVWDRRPGHLLEWRMDEAEVIDDSGNGYDGVAYEAVYETEGKIGGSYSFSSEGEPVDHTYISTSREDPYSPDSLDMVEGSEVSYFGWFKSRKNLSDLGPLWDSYVIFKPKNSFLLGWGGWNHDGWECNVWNLSNPDQRVYAFVKKPQVAGEWVHVGCVFNGTFLGIYLDGRLAGYDDKVPNFKIQKEGGEYYNLFIGTKNQYAFYNLTWDGWIDEVNIYDRAITPVEVFALYNETRVTSDALFLEIERWKRGEASMIELLSAIRRWKED